MYFTWAELSSCEVRRLAESIRNGWHNSDRLSRSSRLAQPEITVVDRPNQIHKLIYGSSARINPDRNLMHFYLLLNSVCLELRSASESIQLVYINLGRPKFEFDLAHVKYGVWNGPKRLLSTFPGRRVVFWSVQDVMTSVTGSDISLP